MPDPIYPGHRPSRYRNGGISLPPGAVDDHTDYIGTGEAFGSWANAAHDAYWEAHQHYVTNTTIDLDGDSAHVETYWIVVGRRKLNSATDMHGGRYVDRFEKRNGRWAIAARVCVYEWGLRSEEAVQQLATFPLGTQGADDISFMRPLTSNPPANGLNLAITEA